MTTWQAIGVGTACGLIVVSLIEAYIVMRYGK